VLQRHGNDVRTAMQAAVRSYKRRARATIVSPWCCVETANSLRQPSRGMLVD
jgi:hypothetical protein